MTVGRQRSRSSSGAAGSAADVPPPPPLDARVLLKAVERSRMCASTYSRFATANLDRSLKAAEEYCRGKAVRAVAAAIEMEIIADEEVPEEG